MILDISLASKEAGNHRIISKMAVILSNPRLKTKFLDPTPQVHISVV